MRGPEHLDPTRPNGLDTDANLFDFFHAYVDQAVDQQSAPVSEEGVWYLTGLLVDQARPAAEPEGATLAELHLRAREGDRATAIRSYRSLGDQALVTSGFFPRSFSRKLVSRQYYIDMGAAAYDSLAGLLRAAGFGRGQVVGDARPGTRGLDAVYDELAGAFEACAEVLTTVREAVRDSTEGKVSDADIVAMYEEWLVSGNPRLAARLAGLGVVPGKGDGRGHH